MNFRSLFFRRYVARSAKILRYVTISWDTKCAQNFEFHEFWAMSPCQGYKICIIGVLEPCKCTPEACFWEDMWREAPKIWDMWSYHVIQNVLKILNIRSLVRFLRYVMSEGSTEFELCHHVRDTKYAPSGSQNLVNVLQKLVSEKICVAERRQFWGIWAYHWLESEPRSCKIGSPHGPKSCKMMMEPGAQNSGFCRKKFWAAGSIIILQHPG